MKCNPFLNEPLNSTESGEDSAWTTLIRIPITASIALLCLSLSAAAQNPPASSALNNKDATVCGAGQAKARALNLKDEADCAAYLIVHRKEGGKPDASRITDYFDSLAFLAVVEGIAPQAKSNAAQMKQDLFVTEQETRRTDKQVGASPRAQGSTSLTEKPNFVDLLGLAVENGTIQQEVNGTTLTLSSSPYALTTLASGDTATNYQRHGDLSRVGVSATFNISNQDSVLSNATRRQLAEWSVRIRLTADQSTRSASFYRFWRDNIEKRIGQEGYVLTRAQAALFQSETELVRRRVEDRFYNTSDGAQKGAGFVQDYLDKHAGLTDDQLVAGLRDEILARLKQEISDKVDSFGLDAASRNKIITVTMPALNEAHVVAEQGLRDLQQEIKRRDSKPVASFQYTNVRGTTSSSYSALKFLLEKSTSDSMKLDFNVGGSVYSNPNRSLNQQTVRDYGTALSWEGKLGRSPFSLQQADQAQVTFAFSGRYERLLENRKLPGKKADIASAAGKLEIPIFTGVTLPLSITYSNANEATKKDHVRFNFGFTFDADKLYRLLQFEKQKTGTSP